MCLFYSKNNRKSHEKYFDMFVCYRLNLLILSTGIVSAWCVYMRISRTHLELQYNMWYGSWNGEISISTQSDFWSDFTTNYSNWMKPVIKQFVKSMSNMFSNDWLNCIVFWKSWSLCIWDWDFVQCCCNFYLPQVPKVILHWNARMFMIYTKYSDWEIVYFSLKVKMRTQF